MIGGQEGQQVTCAGTGMHGIAASPVTKSLNQMHSLAKGCLWRGTDGSFSLMLRPASCTWKEIAWLGSEAS